MAKHTYTIRDHGDGKTYDIIDPEPEPKPKEKSTAELIAEALSLNEYNKREKEKLQQVKQEQEPINEVIRFSKFIKNEN